MNEMEKWLYNPVTVKLGIIVAGILCIHILLRILKRSIPQYIRDSDTRYRARKFASFLGYLTGTLFVVAV